MSIEIKVVERVADLAHLKFAEDEIQKFTSKFNQVIELVESINQVDTTDVEPMANALDLTQRLRKDVVTEENRRDQLMQNAPEQESGLFLVPKVID